MPEHKMVSISENTPKGKQQLDITFRTDYLGIIRRQYISKVPRRDAVINLLSYRNHALLDQV